jgi:hypothetical protein
MGRTDHLELPLARPFLGQQLLTWIHGEAVTPFAGRLPAVQAWPHPHQLQLGGSLVSQQQRATFQGVCGLKQLLQNDQAMPIYAQELWPWGSHPDTL